ncbi:Acg family FMN-binding oxidoreductase [Mycolicibacterium pyrenivorans]|uniref:Acg family FMN-binding oxidoreductase n=1 Tax=Mycolicibacterium pyrenivorans TaxID=187102 RepID=UPI0021F2F621|nr:NAD(P)H nitroreductase [Mycolicibacterium pyrenivorans]MCV7151294.1 NAD(P)H nitroreductase [Mycolicibacterium pyrenivorans]
MTAHFPDDITLRAALTLATRAPSVHNSQPWLWRVGPHSLHLHADRSLHLPHTDPDRRELMISCGASLNHAVVALAALGWQAKIHRFPNPDDPDHLAAITLHRHAAGETDIELAAAIAKRRTDRRNFTSRPVDLGDIAWMGARVARMGVSLRRVETTTDFKAVLTQAVWEHAFDPDYAEELTMWSGRYAAAAGVPARNIPESDPRAAVPSRVFAGTALDQPPQAPPEFDHGVLLALGTSADDDLSRLRAGEATSLALLTASARGLATCPVSEVLEVAETRTMVRSEIFDERYFPQMLVRVGWAPPDADPLPATPRRPLHERVTRLDGSPLGGWDGV